MVSQNVQDPLLGPILTPLQIQEVIKQHETESHICITFHFVTLMDWSSLLPNTTFITFTQNAGTISLSLQQRLTAIQRLIQCK